MSGIKRNRIWNVYCSQTLLFDIRFESYNGIIGDRGTRDMLRITINQSRLPVHKTWRFSQLLLLLSFRHILLRISRARFRLSAVLLLCNLERILDLLPCLLIFLSRDSRSRICFSTPTSNSSTLCWIPLEVSMNLQPREVANCFPSKKDNTFDDNFAQIF